MLLSEAQIVNQAEYLILERFNTLTQSVIGRLNERRMILGVEIGYVLRGGQQFIPDLE